MSLSALLWTVVVIILVLWLAGWAFSIAGNLVHLLLIAAIIVVVVNLLTGRRLE